MSDLIETGETNLAAVARWAKRALNAETEHGKAAARIRELEAIAADRLMLRQHRDRDVEHLKAELVAIEAATIERCAQVANKMQGPLSSVATAIRALKPSAEGE